jgi:hypothetical protein
MADCTVCIYSSKPVLRLYICVLHPVLGQGVQTPKSGTDSGSSSSPDRYWIFIAVLGRIGASRRHADGQPNHPHHQQDWNDAQDNVVYPLGSSSRSSDGPENIRELQNIVERSVILCSGDIFWIEKAWLVCPEPARQELPSPLPDTLQNQEREMIETALAECKGKVAGPEGAAEKLGIPRSTLASKIKKPKIKKHKFISE